jgi:Protein of unknown function (DUF3160)
MHKEPGMPQKKFRLLSYLLLASMACAGCGSDPETNKVDGSVAPDGGAGRNVPVVPGIKVDGQPSAALKAEFESVSQALATVATLDAKTFAETYPVSFIPASARDLGKTKGIDLIQKSAIAMDATETELLTRNGFVMSDRRTFPGFPYAYQTIYGEDLPVYISADAILNAVHRSYDDILKAIEEARLIGDLEALLKAMRTGLGAGRIAVLGKTTTSDADFYLSVALSLLTEVQQAPVAGAIPAEIADFHKKARTGAGYANKVLFGVNRRMDFSQFTPRGHYTDSEKLKQYFRAMMWLGRVDLRLIETQDNGYQVFHRRQFDAAVALRQLIDAQSETLFNRIDSTIEAFVGESDNMTVPQLKTLLDALGASSLEALAKLPDETIANTILSGDHGAQRISSHFMVTKANKTLPLSRTFLLFGQRYVVDSHVFSNVVFDRVKQGKDKRMMPDPLDAAFAALHNNLAGNLLAPQLSKYDYASELASMRVLVEKHEPAFWTTNLYNLWLGALRTLSPGSGDTVRPTIAQTQPWGRRILNTQLASWAELRHDTILYAKQSYTGGLSCEFPDAYVEPYPEFFAALEVFAKLAQTHVASLALGDLGKSVTEYFAKLESHVGVLKDMATNQASGLPPTAQHMAFMNTMITIHQGCGDPVLGKGWFSDLYYDWDAGAEYDPTIADVHTQPTDEGGNVVGRVLHVATGRPRLMVVTVDTPQGPRAFVGAASSYFEKVTDDWKRYTDEEWAKELQPKHPADVAWMSDLVAGSQSMPTRTWSNAQCLQAF